MVDTDVVQLKQMVCWDMGFVNIWLLTDQNFSIAMVRTEFLKSEVVYNNMAYVTWTSWFILQCKRKEHKQMWLVGCQNNTSDTTDTGWFILLCINRYYADVIEGTQYVTT